MLFYYEKKVSESEVRKKLTVNEVTLSFLYDITVDDLGSIGEFIIDLDVDSTEAIANIKYELREGNFFQFT